MPLNMLLATRLGLSPKRIAKIEVTQAVAEAVMDRMRTLDPAQDRQELLGLVNAWASAQFILQAAWGFAEDSSFHRFWLLPHCQCPKLDNEERWGTKYTIRASQCPLHGDFA